MLQERIDGMVEEIFECGSLDELRAIARINAAEGCNCPEVVTAVRLNLPRLRAAAPRVEAPTAEVPRLARGPYSGATKRYKLLDKNVSWTTVPQVHAVMAILSAHMEVGDVLPEDKIVEAMEANVQVLQTSQGGKRIWKYYRGKHNRGLEAHGNIEEVK